MSFSKEQQNRRFTGTVPEDLISYILVRVPAKDLVGLKLVSKAWLSLVSSPDFAKSHLAITSAEEKEEIHIVHSYDNEDVDKDSISLMNLSSRQLITQLNFPSMLCKKIIGCACGIVCIRTTVIDGSKLYLWNPATNQSKYILPPSSPCHDEALGFGFDEINNDFKIVRLAWRVKPTCVQMMYTGPYAKNCQEIFVEVYSCNSNVWRRLPGKPTDIPYKYSKFDVYVDTGILCATGYYGIITFDLQTEVLTCAAIKYPVPTFDGIISFHGFDAQALISNFKDSIAVVIYKHVNSTNNYTCKFNLWVLDNVACLRGGGIEASWTLVLNIDAELPIYLVHGYLNSGDFLFYLRNNKLCLYSPDNKEPRYFTHPFFLDQVFKYSKSLFTIPGFKQVNWKASSCYASTQPGIQLTHTKVSKNIIARLNWS